MWKPSTESEAQIASASSPLDTLPSSAPASICWWLSSVRPLYVRERISEWIDRGQQSELRPILLEPTARLSKIMLRLL